MSGEDIAALQEKMRDNPFVQLQEHFSSYYKINKETENSPHYITPIQFKLPRNAAGKEFPFQYCRIPIRHFFSWSRRLLTKKVFKSAETVNVKFGVYEFGDKGQ